MKTYIIEIQLLDECPRKPMCPFFTPQEKKVYSCESMMHKRVWRCGSENRCKTIFGRMEKGENHEDEHHA